MESMKPYLAAIEGNLKLRNATEHTHRPALKSLIESLRENITATNEPKREQCGAPDFIVTRHGIPLGYIEAKDVGKPLDAVEKDEQLRRYRESLGNLLLTDYLEFRWYVGGAHRLTARLARPEPSGKLKIDKEGVAQVTEILSAFLNEHIPLLRTPKDLACRMAALARLIRATLLNALNDEEGGSGLQQQLEGFRKVLLHDLTEAQFADMYAQTICYGLFAARSNARLTAGTHFVREHAAFDLPKTNPFLRRMFNHIAGPELDGRIVWIVDDLTNLLDRTDMEGILRDFGRRTRQEDPIVHFYETFLAAYDPKMREARGVYYTPEPVVSYIVRSVDHLLKTDFALPDGLADTGMILRKAGPAGESKEIHRVLILDPATGTGTFLHGVIDQIHEHISDRGQIGAWGGEEGYVARHLLPRIFGFELLMAPYAVAHMKLGLQLAQYGYDFGSDERLRIYLTNTLEEAYKISDLPLFTQWLVEEVNAAGAVKQEAPVMVILGNPPYSGHSANTGPWIAQLLRGKDGPAGLKTDNYFEVDGRPLGEKNPKWLNDDYVKFIRFAQWRIEKTGYGILAFITNHGYLDNPTFRGMRQSLMKTFDAIYLLDLHGNSKKKERCPDGSKDENVFDIQQGVAIGIFVKNPLTGKSGSEEKSAGAKTAGIRHAHLWGLRELYEDAPEGRILSGGKYHWLRENNLATTDWQTVTPQPPFYLFLPQDENLRAEYERGWKVTEMMPVNNTGLITSRDGFVFGFSRDELQKRLQDFVSSSVEHAREHYGLRDVRERTLEKAHAIAKNLSNIKSHIVPCQYRPFDIRMLFYHHSLVRWPVYDVMNQMLAGRNLGLISARSNKSQSQDHFYCSRLIMETKCGESTTQACLFPLYLHISDSLEFDVSSNVLITRRPNLAPAFLKDFSARLGMDFIPDGQGDRVQTFGPEDVFFYMYAVFHSPAYRQRYADFLKIDFPRLPLTGDADLFRALCGFGAELTALHLLEKTPTLITAYPVAGDNAVETVSYAEGSAGDAGRVWINKTQYFARVPPEVWDFHIGGYQVCQKWLKDRKGRKLSWDDITHYQRIVAALAATFRLMATVDETINTHGGWPL
ncbi:MAG: type ISP restriction/modification enzyme [Smithellaceae bacterium]|nr:type ISP restriction/modification enzyme [Smithellaceae bacterium]